MTKIKLSKLKKVLEDKIVTNRTVLTELISVFVGNLLKGLDKSAASQLSKSILRKWNETFLDATFEIDKIKKMISIISKNLACLVTEPKLNKLSYVIFKELSCLDIESEEEEDLCDDEEEDDEEAEEEDDEEAEEEDDDSEEEDDDSEEEDDDSEEEDDDSEEDFQDDKFKIPLINTTDCPFNHILGILVGMKQQQQNMVCTALSTFLKDEITINLIKKLLS